MTTPTGLTRNHLASVLADLAGMIGAVDATRYHDPTRCTEYDVEALRDHVLGWLTTFAAGFSDPTGHAQNADIGDYHAPVDPAATADAVHAAADQLDEALRDGAAARPLWLGDAQMPGELALGMILWEYQVHGWDLAVATGQHWAPPAAAVAESLAFAPGMLSEDYQGEGKTFGPRVMVSEDAPALHRLLGLSGRSRPESTGGIEAWRPGPADPDPAKRGAGTPDPPDRNPDSP